MTIDLHTSNVATGSIEMPAPANEDLHYDLFMSADNVRLHMPTNCEQISSGHACTFLKLPTGDYEIEVTSDRDGKSRKGTQGVTVAPNAHIAVGATDSSGTRIEGIVSFQSPVATTRPSIDLQSLNSDIAYSNQPIDEEGRFSIAAVQPGNYFIEVHVGGDSYVCGTENGGVSRDGEIVSVPAGVSDWRLNVALCSRAAAVTGRVDSAPDQKTKVRVAIIEADTGIARETDTDSGQFSFSGLAPGSYVVAAWPQSRVVAYANHGVQERLAKLGSHVMIEHTGDVKTMDIPLIEGMAPLL